MFNNLIKHSLRSFNRQWSYIIINITGLSIGIACSLIIALYVLYEASYDSFNVKKDRIFDIALNFRIGGQGISRGGGFSENEENGRSYDNNL
jgi:putative ABC transport system permease protein